MAYEIEVKELPVQPALSIRFRTPVEQLSQRFGEVYGAVFAYMQELGEYPAGPPFATYYNEDMQDLDVEAGFPTSKSLPGNGRVEAVDAPHGRVVSCLYTGPYTGIEAAYGALTEWVAANGYESSGICYEYYLNDPGETPPEELQTQIMFAVK